MAYASVKITANSSDYRTQMKSAAAQMKELSSEYSLAATKAKLFGSESDSLKAKAESLTQKISVQKNIVQMNKEQQERLTDQLGKQKTKQEELKTKVDAAKKAYEDEKKATGENSDASKALKEELDKLEQEFKDNETAIGKTGTALSNQTVKTNKAETALMEMEAELEEVNKELKNHKLNEFADHCDAAGKKMESFGKKMSVVSGGIAGLATAAVKTASEFDSAMSQVAAVSGATGKDLDALRDKAREMGSKTKFSASEAAEAMNYMAMAGWKTGDMLDGIEGIMNLAAASGEDLATTSDIVTDALTAFGLKSKDSGHFADILATASSNANTNVAMMGETFKYCAPVAGALGFSAEDTAEAIGLMANAGIKASQSGTAMRTMLSRFSKAILLSGESIGEMTIKTTNADGSMRGLGEILTECREAFSGMTEAEKASNAQNIVGKNAMSGFLAVMNAAPEDIDKLNKAINSCDGTSQKMAETMQDNLSGQLTILKSQLQETAISFGEKMIPHLRDGVKVIQDVVDKFNGMSESQQRTILKVSLFTATIGPAAIGIGKFAQGISSTIKFGQNMAGVVTKIIGKIAAKTTATAAGAAADAAGTAAEAAHTAATATATTVTGGMTAAQAALNAVMNLCPIILIVTLIAGLIAAGVALYKNWDKVKEKLSQLWNNVKEKFNSIKETITGAFSKAKEAATNKVNEIKDTVANSQIGQAASKVFSGIKKTVSNLTNAATETVKQNLSNMKKAYEENGGGIKGVVAAGWEGIKGYYTSGFTFVNKLTGGKLTEIKSKFSEKINEIKTKVSEGWQDMKTTVTTKMMEWRTNASNKLNEIKTNFSSKVSEIKSDWSSKFTNIKDTATNLMQTAKQNVSTKLDNMKAVYTEKGGGMKGIVSATFTGIKDTMNSLMSTANTLTGGNLDNIKSAFSEKLNSAKSTVSSVMDNIKSAFSSKMDEVRLAVTGAIEGIKGIFNFSWSLPEIRLPHFSIAGEFSLNPPSVPSFSIDWYKTGAIMNSSMIFGMNGNTLLAGGEPETGGEAILPLTPFYAKLNDMLDRKLAAVQQIQNVYVENHTYIDGDEVSSRTVSKVDAKMVQNRRKGR